MLNSDPAPGFFAATAQATSRAPTFGEIRRGSFGEEGWAARQHAASRGSGSGSSRDKGRSWSGSSWSRLGKKGSRDSVKDGSGHSHGGATLEPFAPLTEEPTRISEDVREEAGHGQGGVGEAIHEKHGDLSLGESAVMPRSPLPGRSNAELPETKPLEKHANDPGVSAPPHQQDISRTHTSGYIPPPKLPWTQSTAIALKGFWRWFITPFGFLVTLYGLNVVAWGGMLFLLLCNASPAMCHAPIPTPENRQKMSPAAALDLPGPYYFNCNDINSPRRIWIEIDSQILNALFCVTGFGLVPWRFRDLYYILRYRFASARKQGLEGKMYGLRVLAGIHRGWFRLPGSETLDTTDMQDYMRRLEKGNSSSPTSSTGADLESNALGSPGHDIRVPVPLSKAPTYPMTSVRAPPTKIWLMDFFIWCQVWNTFFQCCLCGFMWGQDRYDRPPWSTGLFVALACIIAGVGGVVSYVEGRKVKRVEGVAPEPLASAGDGSALEQARTNVTERESVYADGMLEKPSDR